MSKQPINIINITNSSLFSSRNDQLDSTGKINEKIQQNKFHYIVDEIINDEPYPITENSPRLIFIYYTEDDNEYYVLKNKIKDDYDNYYYSQFDVSISSFVFIKNTKQIFNLKEINQSNKQIWECIGLNVDENDLNRLLESMILRINLTNVTTASNVIINKNEVISNNEEPTKYADITDDNLYLPNISYENGYIKYLYYKDYIYPYNNIYLTFKINTDGTINFTYKKDETDDNYYLTDENNVYVYDQNNQKIRINYEDIYVNRFMYPDPSKMSNYIANTDFEFNGSATSNTYQKYYAVVPKGYKSKTYQSITQNKKPLLQEQKDYLTKDNNVLVSKSYLNSVKPGKITLFSNHEFYDDSTKVTTNTLCSSETFNCEKNIALDECSHAEGYDTKAVGQYAHAEGKSTVACGKCTHAAGQGSIARGDGSMAVGYYTVAQNTAMFACGYSNTLENDTESKFISSDSNNKDADDYNNNSSKGRKIFVVGNGKEYTNKHPEHPGWNRKDAFKVFWSGNVAVNNNLISKGFVFKKKVGEIPKENPSDTNEPIKYIYDYKEFNDIIYSNDPVYQSDTSIYSVNSVNKLIYENIPDYNLLSFNDNNVNYSLEDESEVFNEDNDINITNYINVGEYVFGFYISNYSSWMSNYYINNTNFNLYYVKFDDKLKISKTVNSTIENLNIEESKYMSYNKFLFENNKLYLYLKGCTNESETITINNEYLLIVDFNNVSITNDTVSGITSNIYKFGNNIDYKTYTLLNIQRYDEDNIYLMYVNELIDNKLFIVSFNTKTNTLNNETSEGIDLPEYSGGSSSIPSAVCIHNKVIYSGSNTSQQVSVDSSAVNNNTVIHTIVKVNNSFTVKPLQVHYPKDSEKPDYIPNNLDYDKFTFISNKLFIFLKDYYKIIVYDMYTNEIQVITTFNETIGNEEKYEIVSSIVKNNLEKNKFNVYLISYYIKRIGITSNFTYYLLNVSIDFNLKSYNVYRYDDNTLKDNIYYTTNRHDIILNNNMLCYYINNVYLNPHKTYVSYHSINTAINNNSVCSNSIYSNNISINNLTLNSNKITNIDKSSVLTDNNNTIPTTDKVNETILNNIPTRFQLEINTDHSNEVF